MTKEKRLKAIEEWLNNFPCSKFFDDNIGCIKESIDAEELLKFVETRIKND
jgi:hypothetical protein